MSRSEAQTRKDLIDKALRLAGWNVDDPSQVVHEYDIDLISAGVVPPVAAESGALSSHYGHQYVDYVLMLRGRPVAVIEAKRTSKDAELGKEQGLRYAENLQKLLGGPIPFVLFTNGHEIYLWDTEQYPPVKVHGFPTPLDLEWMDQRRRTRRPLSVELIDTQISGRGYQIAAIRAVLEGIEASKRNFLLVMATGTGKTRTAMGLVDVLLRAQWAKRVLFLVDRVALRDQAVDAFKEHLPGSPYWPRTEGASVEKGWAANRRVYCATYPTMLNLIERGDEPGSWISPHFFDVVIADESHRSLFNVYRSVLEYFSALKLGLTATPKGVDDDTTLDTFKLFDRDLHDPTFAYTFEEAVSHDPPYLSNFEVLKVRSKFQLEGIKGGTLPPTVQTKLIAEGKDVEHIDFEGTDLERKVTNAGTNALIVREFMEECIKDESGTLPGKSIFFAISKGHARRLQKLFDRMYPAHKGKLARVLVSEDRFVHGKGGLLDQFKNQDMPRVAISVDMLDTGVDVPEVVNLVFAKPVYSYRKFWQMIGRGTRVLPEPKKRKAWCRQKDKFLIIDCWANFDFFKMNPKGKEPGDQVPMPVRLFRCRLDQLEAAMAADRTDLVESIKADLRADLATLPVNNVIISEKRADLEAVSAPEFWARLDGQDLGRLRGTIAPLMRARPGVQIKNMRFETEVVELSTALLTENQDAFTALQESLVAQVTELPLTVNVVKAEQDLIDDVLRPAWWTEPTDDKLAALRTRLAPLMRYRQRRRDPMMMLDLGDATVIKETVEFGPEHERMDTAVYRERVEDTVRALVEENAVLQKLQRGEEPTEQEIFELAELLQAQDLHITEDLLRKVYDHKAARFVQFMRHILGLEELVSWSETVTGAFDAFIAEHNTLTELQIRFLHMLRTFLLQTGRLERRDLTGAPFTQIHPRGIRGVFGGPQLKEVLDFAEGLVA